MYTIIYVTRKHKLQVLFIRILWFFFKNRYLSSNIYQLNLTSKFGMPYFKKKNESNKIKNLVDINFL